MSAPTVITPQILLQAVYDRLQTWATDNKAKRSIARDPYHVLELLGEIPEGLRLIFHWLGEEALGDQEQLPLCTQKWEVIVSMNLGLRVKPDEALLKDSTARPALFRLARDVRDQVLAMQWPEEITQEFASSPGTEPVVTPDGIPLAAYRITFALNVSATEPDFTFTRVDLG